MPDKTDLWQNEQELLKALIAGNELAIKWTYKQHFPVIQNFIRLNGGTDQEAKDVYQEGFLIFYDKIRLPGFTLECKIKTFLYSVCRRVWLNELKRKKNSIQNIEDIENFFFYENEDFEEHDAKEKEIEFLSQSLNQLGEPCRTLLTDFYINNLSMIKIAEKMGYTNADNAKNQKYKCLLRLKKIFLGEKNIKGSTQYERN